MKFLVASAPYVPILLFISGSKVRRGILTGGTWCIDHNRLLDHWPRENGRADIQSSVSSGGASSCNMAIDMKKLDSAMPVATIGMIGDDSDGRFLCAEADRYGIDRSRLLVSKEAQTDYTDAFTSLATGHRTHISFFAASHLLTPDHFDFARSSHRIFHLGLPGIHRVLDAPWKDDANGWVTVLKKARAEGFETNMELASISAERLSALLRPCLPHLDLLIANDHEIGGIAGLTTVEDGQTDIEACKAAAEKLLDGGVRKVVVAHFPAGAIMASPERGIVTMPSVDVPASAKIGANGAGDAFAAGFLYGWHEGWPAAETLRLAHASAAASLRHITTYGGVESWSNCLALADGWGWRRSLQSFSTGAQQ